MACASDSPDHPKPKGQPCLCLSFFEEKVVDVRMGMSCCLAQVAELDRLCRRIWWYPVHSLVNDLCA